MSCLNPSVQKQNVTLHKYPVHITDYCQRNLKFNEVQLFSPSAAHWRYDQTNEETEDSTGNIFSWGLIHSYWCVCGVELKKKTLYSSDRQTVRQTDCSLCSDGRAGSGFVCTDNILHLKTHSWIGTKRDETTEDVEDLSTDGILTDDLFWSISVLIYHRPDTAQIVIYWSYPLQRDLLILIIRLCPVHLDKNNTFISWQVLEQLTPSTTCVTWSAGVCSVRQIWDEIVKQLPNITHRRKYVNSSWNQLHSSLCPPHSDPHYLLCYK